MATTVTVAGKVLLPSGAGATGGTIEITLSGLSEAGETEDAGVTQKITGKITATISALGAVSQALVPNDAITPPGSYYTAVYTPTGQTPWTEYWQLASAPATIDIGDVTLLSSPTVAPATMTIPSIAAASLPTAALGNVGQTYRVLGGTGGEDLIKVCVKNQSEGYSWQVVAAGGP